MQCVSVPEMVPRRPTPVHHAALRYSQLETSLSVHQSGCPLSLAVQTSEFSRRKCSITTIRPPLRKVDVVSNATQSLNIVNVATPIRTRTTNTSIVLPWENDDYACSKSKLILNIVATPNTEFMLNRKPPNTPPRTRNNGFTT